MTRCRTIDMTPQQEALTRRFYHPLFMSMCRANGIDPGATVTWRPQQPPTPNTDPLGDRSLSIQYMPSAGEATSHGATECHQ